MPSSSGSTMLNLLNINANFFYLYSILPASARKLQPEGDMGVICACSHNQELLSYVYEVKKICTLICDSEPFG